MTIEQAPTREFPFHPCDHEAIAALTYAEAGILLPSSKAPLVYSRLARRVRARGMTSFGAYVALLEDDAAERTRAIDALTTNHTSFFRESHHFEHFLSEVWPTLASRLATGGSCRVWSAACSSGEEPYTLAMAILGRNRGAASRLAKKDFRMLATDLSGEILATARSGRYAADTVRSIPADLRESWLDRSEDGTMTMCAEIRPLVTFRALNLLEDWPMRQLFDAIFCRNVMIYFDDTTKARLQTRLADQLAPGGMLYIGHSERLDAAVADRFTCVGRTAFRKIGR